jgi:hypothetical protein
MTTMPKSPTEEIRAVRQQLAARFGNDMARIVDDLRRQQRQSGRTYICLPKRLPRDSRAANQPT